MVDVTASQASFGASRGDLEHITHSHRRKCFRLFVKSNLGAEPIVPEASVRAAGIGLGDERSCIPAKLDIAQEPELEKPGRRALGYSFFRPEVIVPILEFQHSVLRHIRRIGNRGPVRIRRNLIGIAPRLAADPLSGGPLTRCQAEE